MNVCVCAAKTLEKNNWKKKKTNKKCISANCTQLFSSCQNSACPRRWQTKKKITMTKKAIFCVVKKQSPQEYGISFDGLYHSSEENANGVSTPLFCWALLLSEMWWMLWDISKKCCVVVVCVVCAHPLAARGHVMWSFGIREGAGGGGTTKEKKNKKPFAVCAAVGSLSFCISLCAGQCGGWGHCVAQTLLLLYNFSSSLRSAALCSAMPKLERLWLHLLTSAEVGWKWQHPRPLRKQSKWGRNLTHPLRSYLKKMNPRFSWA